MGKGSQAQGPRGLGCQLTAVGHEVALAAAEAGDLSVLERLVAVLATPYDHGRAAAEDRAPAPDGGAGYRTFCGT